MQHLNLEALARLVDEPAALDEAAHLELCGECSGELSAMAEQTAGLGALSAAAPPPEQWTALRARLRRERLVRDPSPHQWARWHGQAAWWRAAAAVSLFLLGGAAGATAARAFSGRDAADLARQTTVRTAEQAQRVGTRAASAGIAAEAADPALALQQAEQAYLAALARYGEAAGTQQSLDPVTRLAALEEIVSTTREALNEAPADPVINGYHLAALGQRQATLRQITRTAEKPWF